MSLLVFLRHVLFISRTRWYPSMRLMVISYSILKISKMPSLKVWKSIVRLFSTHLTALLGRLLKNRILFKHYQNRYRKYFSLSEGYFPPHNTPSRDKFKIFWPRKCFLACFSINKGKENWYWVCEVRSLKIKTNFQNFKSRGMMKNN